MIVNEEFPCRNARKGGAFNMGTFAVRSGARAELLLSAWSNSSFHRVGRVRTWPARQGAFSHDPAVYERFRDEVCVYPAACWSSSPFSHGIGHFPGGLIPHVYDPKPARRALARLHACVERSLEARRDPLCRYSGNDPSPRST